MSATDQHRVLVRYCERHRCSDCSMNVVQLGCGDPDDLCVVSLAILYLERQAKAVAS